MCAFQVAVAGHCRTGHRDLRELTATSCISTGANLDVFHGFWGGMVRKMVEHRIRHEVPRVLMDFRNRLDRGNLAGVASGTQ